MGRHQPQVKHVLDPGRGRIPSPLTDESPSHFPCLGALERGGGARSRVLPLGPLDHLRRRRASQRSGDPGGHRCRPHRRCTLVAVQTRGCSVTRSHSKSTPLPGLRRGSCWSASKQRAARAPIASFADVSYASDHAHDRCVRHAGICFHATADLARNGMAPCPFDWAMAGLLVIALGMAIDGLLATGGLRSRIVRELFIGELLGLVPGLPRDPTPVAAKNFRWPRMGGVAPRATLVVSLLLASMVLFAVAMPHRAPTQEASASARPDEAMRPLHRPPRRSSLPTPGAYAGGAAEPAMPPLTTAPSGRADASRQLAHCLLADLPAIGTQPRRCRARRSQQREP